MGFTVMCIRWVGTPAAATADPQALVSILRGILPTGEPFPPALLRTTTTGGPWLNFAARFKLS
jgi:hypothetical protein